MTEALHGAQSLIELLVARLGYGGVAVVMFLENIIPPIPAEFVLPFAGFLISEGAFTFWLVLLASTAGSFLGTAIFYLLGRRWGEGPIVSWFALYGGWMGVRDSDMQRALQLFRKHDGLVVFWARFIPGLRSIISLPAGITGMPAGRFTVLTLAGTILWNSVLIGGGILLGRHWGRLLLVLEQFELLLWTLIAAGLLVWLIARLRRRAALKP